MKCLLKQNLYILTTRFRPKIMLYKGCARDLRSRAHPLLYSISHQVIVPA